MADATKKGQKLGITDDNRPASARATAPGAITGATPGLAPVATPGVVPIATLGVISGAMPEVVPGTTPGSAPAVGLRSELRSELVSGLAAELSAELASGTLSPQPSFSDAGAISSCAGIARAGLEHTALPGYQAPRLPQRPLWRGLLGLGSRDNGGVIPTGAITPNPECINRGDKFPTPPVLRVSSGINDRSEFNQANDLSFRASAAVNFFPLKLADFMPFSPRQPALQALCLMEQQLAQYRAFTTLQQLPAHLNLVSPSTSSPPQQARAAVSGVPGVPGAYVNPGIPGAYVTTSAPRVPDHDGTYLPYGATGATGVGANIPRADTYAEQRRSLASRGGAVTPSLPNLSEPPLGAYSGQAEVHGDRVSSLATPGPNRADAADSAGGAVHCAGAAVHFAGAAVHGSVSGVARGVTAVPDGTSTSSGYNKLAQQLGTGIAALSGFVVGNTGIEEHQVLPLKDMERLFTSEIVRIKQSFGVNRFFGEASVMIIKLMMSYCLMLPDLTSGQKHEPGSLVRHNLLVAIKALELIEQHWLKAPSLYAVRNPLAVNRKPMASPDSADLSEDENTDASTSTPAVSARSTSAARRAKSSTQSLAPGTALSQAQSLAQGAAIADAAAYAPGEAAADAQGEALANAPGEAAAARTDAPSAQQFMPLWADEESAYSAPGLSEAIEPRQRTGTAPLLVTGGNFTGSRIMRDLYGAASSPREFALLLNAMQQQAGVSSQDKATTTATTAIVAPPEHAFACLDTELESELKSALAAAQAQQLKLINELEATKAGGGEQSVAKVSGEASGDNTKSDSSSDNAGAQDSAEKREPALAQDSAASANAESTSADSTADKATKESAKADSDNEENASPDNASEDVERDKLADSGLAESSFAESGLAESGLAESSFADRVLAERDSADSAFAASGSDDNDFADSDFADSELANSELEDRESDDSLLAESEDNLDLEDNDLDMVDLLWLEAERDPLQELYSCLATIKEYMSRHRRITLRSETR